MKMMIDPHEYNISIRKIEFEGESYFEARVKELPDLAEYGETYSEVYELAIDTIETTAQIFSEKEKKMPTPAKINAEYSGRVTLRLPKGLHRKLALSAIDDGVSLNQHMINILTYDVGVLDGSSIYAAIDEWITIKQQTKRKMTSRTHMKGDFISIPIEKPEENYETVIKKVG